MLYLHWDYLEDHENRTLQSGSVHERRSLDTAGYSYHSPENLKRRNRDQVVAKHLAPAKKKNRGSGETLMVVVDQLWVWILDTGRLPSP